MKILYVGPLNKGGTCLQRMQAMKDLGCTVTPVDTEPADVKKKQRQLLFRLKRKIIGPSDLAGVNERIIKLLKEDVYHILWIDKGLSIKAETLQAIRQISPKTLITGYSPDDMLNPDNQTRHFLKGLTYYDIFFTTKSYGVEELKGLGCKRVEFVDNAYDPNTHRPMEITVEDRLKYGGPVGFIGTYERERAESILYLAKNGVNVRVWGDDWNRKYNLLHPNIKIEGKPLLSDDYARGICSFDINIVFLRKINRDLQTTRSIEVPACGGFMLAERTSEHKRLFEENKEAVYFSSNEELVKNVRYFLDHDEERRRIAQSARRRCLSYGYSNKDRITDMFQRINFSRDIWAKQNHIKEHSR
jgi:spore maturation protein CgeB